MQEITMQSIMTREVMCAQPDAALSEVTNIMRDRRYSCVVIAKDGEPAGIITERDMVAILAGINDNPSCLSQKVSNMISRPPVIVNEADSLFDALVIAKAEKVRHLPVVDFNGKLVGLVTQTDLVKAHFHVYERQREIIETAINERTEALLKANEELKTMALEDPLLGIGNRRAMDVDLQHIHASAQRYNFPYSVMLIDIDFFKRYNDHYGHPAGDKALMLVADHVKSGIREADRVYRYGGEEFLVLLPETDQRGAKVSALHLIKTLNSLMVPHCKSPFNILTISIGVECFIPEKEADISWEDVICRADQCLYKAKSRGRKQVYTQQKSTVRLLLKSLRAILSRITLLSGPRNRPSEMEF